MEEWDRIAVGLNVMGVLTVVDRSALAAYCGAYSRWRHAEEALQKRIIKAGGEPLAGLIDKTSNGNVIQNCLIGIANKAAGDMVRYAAEFGMTPSSRARLGVDPGSDKESKFKGLIGAGSGKR
jgi:P27 family predicted phage terminase small subunit